MRLDSLLSRPDSCPTDGVHLNWPDTGSNRTATVLSRCQNLQDNEQMV